MNEKALEIKNLVKEYRKGPQAVNDISLNVERGEFFGFLGPNGAGKSTTIHCITGIAKITSGTIKLFGKDVVKEYRDARLHVGLAPQEFNIDFFGKIRQSLEFVAGYYGVSRKVAKKRTEELLSQFNLEKYADTQFNKLSGGYKRRVILARAMVHDPELLILDEPTAGVDVELRHELWKHLRNLNEKGKTIVLTSHYLEEVELLCNQIAIINDGKIVSCGTKDEYTKNGKSLEEAYLKVTKGETY